MKHYRLPSLLGGKFHRKRMAIPRDSYMVNLPVIGVPDYAGLADVLPTVDTFFKTVTYTQRKARMGKNKIVTYYASSDLSDEEAFDRFTNYLLKRAGATLDEPTE